MSAREMQMEFERRIQLMNPEFELNDKLTSDTIFSFLNAYTQRYIKNNYLQEDVVQDNSRALKKVQDALKGLIVRTILEKQQRDPFNMDIYTDKFILPEDYFLYIRSNSKVSSTYKGDVTGIADSDGDGTCASPPMKYTQIVPNLNIREDDVEKIVSTYYNRAILPQPYVVLNSGQSNDTTDNIYLNVIHDTYTTIESVDLVYYRMPKPFDVIGVDNINVLDHCELPENVHMEIVEGAVEMFITEAKYRLSGQARQQNNQQ